MLAWRDRFPCSRWAIGALVLSVLVKLAFIILTVGSIDAITWDSHASQIYEYGGQSVYERLVPVSYNGCYIQDQVFNHPPFMVHVLTGMESIHQWTGIPVRKWIRVLALFADVGLFLLVLLYFSHLQRPVSQPLLVLLALAPAHLMITGFHANTDPVMIALTVLAAYLIEAQRKPVWGGVAMGLAMCVKILPIILLPAFFLFIPGWRDRLRFIFAAILFWMAVSLPWLWTNPAGIYKNTFGYASIYGQWGFSLLMQEFGAAQWLNDLFYANGRWLPLGCAVVLALVFNLPRPRLKLFYQCGIIVFAFLFLTPGFGIQYLAWLTPWIIMAGWPFAATHLLATGLYALAQYMTWQGGLIMDIANTLTLGLWGRALPALKWAAWLSLLLVPIGFRLAQTSKFGEPTPSPGAES